MLENLRKLSQLEQADKREMAAAAAEHRTSSLATAKPLSAELRVTVSEYGKSGTLLVSFVVKLFSKVI
jgi:hypothetical protein